MVKPKPPRGQSETGTKTPPPETNMEAAAVALRKVTETLATHSIKFDKVLQAVLETKTSLEAKIDSVTTEVNILRAEHRKLLERVTTNEATIEMIHPDVKDLKAQLQRQETEIIMLQKRTEDAEGRSR
ncbi:hypothetical protein NDU88_002565 [Pleurodeles waltl]|uniref:Uncharacterized protein n=1 Tax=Pleurodeles waltl TaxID=8319 RepID=A0AAV7VCW0_PLEWA|nr:hypothetical protein NDU88_002565 [Pleurodeles waltl]